jgi:hypothetical protein
MEPELSLSDRVAVLEGRNTLDDQLARDLRVMAVQIGRMEKKILEYEQRRASWTKPRLRLLMTEEEIAA